MGDDGKRLAVQVTNETSSRKLVHSLEAFKLANLGARFDDLYCLIFVSKKPRLHKPITPKHYGLKRVIRWDLSDLFTRYSSMEPTILEEILNILEEETKSSQGHLGRESIEVETLMELVYIFSESNVGPCEMSAVEVDPEEKLPKVFKEMAREIKDDYASLLPLHPDLKLAQERVHIDTIRARRIATYLRDWSMSNLEECNNDPKSALKKMVNSLNSTLKQKSRKEYSHSAIRFLLLDHLIKCNVFPLDRLPKDI